MGFRLFDFQCARQHRTEHLVETDVRVVECPVCGKLAARQLAAPRISLEGISGDFPTAADKWVARRESHMRKEARNKERHGTYE